MLLYSKIEGKGTPLLILHGFLGMSDNWKTLGSQFADNGFEVHLLDMRNHGRSFHSDDFTYNDMVKDIIEYCDYHHLDKINIIGHSMGGKAAMFFAVTHPDRVHKLIIADIAPKYYSPHHEDIMAALNAVDFSKKPDRGEIEEMMEPHIKDVGTRQFLMKSLYWKEKGQLALRFNLDLFNREIDSIGEAVPDGAVFENEALFLKGAKSNYIKEEDKERIEKHFPKAQIVTISNAGHWLHAENPTDFYDAVFEFLNK